MLEDRIKKLRQAKLQKKLEYTRTQWNKKIKKGGGRKKNVCHYNKKK